MTAQASTADHVRIEAETALQQNVAQRQELENALLAVKTRLETTEAQFQQAPLDWEGKLDTATKRISHLSEEVKTLTLEKKGLELAMAMKSFESVLKRFTMDKQSLQPTLTEGKLSTYREKGTKKTARSRMHYILDSLIIKKEWVVLKTG